MTTIEPPADKRDSGSVGPVRYRLGTRAPVTKQDDPTEPQRPPQVVGQLDLIELLWSGPVPVAQRFAEFHRKNPVVYETLVRLTREFIRRTGRRRIGIAAIYEACRWEIALSTTEVPRLNNSYRPYYSRLIMSQEEDLQGVFELRKSAADGDS